QRGRQDKLDKQADEDREYTNSRRLVLDARQDQDWERTNYWRDRLNTQSETLNALNIEAAQARQARQPVLDAQQDATFEQNRVLNDFNPRNAQGDSQQCA